MSEKTRSIVVRVVLFLLLIVFVALVTREFTSAKQLWSTVSGVIWYLAVAALILQAIYYGVYALLNQVGLLVVGVKLPWSELWQIVLVSIALNIIVPAGGLGGAAVFVDAAVRHNQSGAKTAAGQLLVLAADMATTLPFIFWGLLVLSAHNQLRSYDILGALLFVLAVIFLFGPLILARWKPKWLLAATRWIQNAINHVGGWFHHPRLLKEGWAKQQAEQFSDASQAIGDNPKELWKIMGLAFILHPITILEVYVLFVSLRQPISLGALVAGVNLGIIFNFIAITPEGVGAVEGVMATIFTSLGIPPQKAITVTLMYRVLSVWIPTFIGIILAQRMQIFSGKRVQEKGEQPEGQGQVKEPDLAEADEARGEEEKTRER